MAGLGIRLYTDEMIHPRFVTELRRRGYDVESCPEAGLSNRGIPDSDQLAYAASQGRAILTFNYVDCLELDADWKAAGREHAGIIVSPSVREVGELLRRVIWHLDHHQVEQQRNLLLWLRAVPGS
ncbi:MAG TPA: DUF5615 family PIN-like protein [Chloroflexota bacterium]|nr:DUF5615 family PIN-like protein [Chloroflexota bacterium]